MKQAMYYMALFIGMLVMEARSQQKNWIARDAQVIFFSSAPLEDIEATSKSGASVLNTTTGEIVFKVRNTSFRFRKKLMQEHFNENYMESDKYPLSEFRGKITDAEIPDRNGSYDVKVSGTLTVHGVAKTCNTTARIVVKDGSLTATCSFDVKVADHNITIPSIVGKNIAEVVNVRISAQYQ